ncbi:MAG: hypothetical protein ACRES5_34825 [Pseudomonas sp.]
MRLRHRKDLTRASLDAATARLQFAITQGRAALSSLGGPAPMAIMAWSQVAGHAYKLVVDAETAATSASEHLKEQHRTLVQRRQLADHAQENALRARARLRQQIDDERSAHLAQFPQEWSDEQ